MGVIRGMDCKVYVNTATYASPTWVEWTCVRDTTVDLTIEEADATCRGSGGMRQTVATLSALEVSGTALKDKTASYLAFEAAARNKAVLDVLVLDGVRTSADTDGWRLDVQIFSWSEGQPFEDMATIDFTMKPTRSDHAPEFISGPIGV